MIKDWHKHFYTIVQHSGYGYGDNTQFENGLEPRNIERKSQFMRVMSEGGVVFDNWMDAEDYCEHEMYPSDYKGLIQNAPGHFCAFKIDNLRLYIPNERKKWRQKETTLELQEQ